MLYMLPRALRYNAVYKTLPVCMVSSGRYLISGHVHSVVVLLATVPRWAFFRFSQALAKLMISPIHECVHQVIKMCTVIMSYVYETHCRGHVFFVNHILLIIYVICPAMVIHLFRFHRQTQNDFDSC